MPDVVLSEAQPAADAADVRPDRGAADGLAITMAPIDTLGAHADLELSFGWAVLSPRGSYLAAVSRAGPDSDDRVILKNGAEVARYPSIAREVPVVNPATDALAFVASD
jgi:hypothetical protein